MANVVVLPIAAGQITEIVDHIAEDNPTAAKNWLSAIDSIFVLLSDHPLMGQKLDAKKLGAVRLHAFSSYAIYYRPIAGGIEVLRVIHSSRDQSRHV